MTPTILFMLARMALLPIRVVPPLMIFPVMLMGVPFAPSVEEVLLEVFPLPPRMAMPSLLGKLLIVLPLIVPVVKCAVVEDEPCIRRSTAVPSETLALVELVKVLFETVMLLIVPVPVST